MLHQHKPREQNGRDAFGRFRAQARSAAIASLSILERNGIDRVYCDLHDDFVVREVNEHGFGYIFYQVKTNSKQNHNWTLNELFGLLTQKSKINSQSESSIKNSFLGKMLLHTIMFDKYCNAIVFQTNINNHDDVNSLHHDILNGKFENTFSNILVGKFNQIYSKEVGGDLPEESIREKLSKIKFETDVQYLKLTDETFESLARDKIYKFSEIDLHYNESKEILLKLLDLIEKKSSGIIHELTIDSIEEKAAVSIDDLLSVMSISKDAYDTLAAGGDNKAIKNASIIQRLLTSAGASSFQIEYCSRCKTNWDLWVRNNRHSIPEFDLQSVLNVIQSTLSSIINHDNNININQLRPLVVSAKKSLETEYLLFDLDRDLIFGAFLAEIVRIKS